MLSSVINGLSASPGDSQPILRSTDFLSEKYVFHDNYYNIHVALAQTNLSV